MAKKYHKALINFSIHKQIFLIKQLAKIKQINLINKIQTIINSHKISNSHFYKQISINKIKNLK